jgi:Skp family chaperone for outer membrane proteins
MSRSGVLAGCLAVVIVLSVYEGSQAHNGGQPAGMRVACVDVVHIFNEYQRQKDLSEEMKDLQDKLQLEGDERKRRIDAQQATISAMSSNDPALVGKTRELLKMQIEYKNWFELKQAEMTREIAIWSVRIYGEVLEVVERIAVQDGYDIVLYRDEFEPLMTDPEAIREQIRSRKVLYSSPRANITQIVLDKLNADYRAQPRTKMLDIP